MGKLLHCADGLDVLIKDQVDLNQNSGLSVLVRASELVGTF